MKQAYSQQSKTQNSCCQNNRHFRMLFSGIPPLEKQNGGDPRLQASEMRTYFTTAHGFTFRPLSPHSVGMRGKGETPHLYPALQACGMTKCVAPGLTARSVTSQYRCVGYSGRIGFTLIELLVVVLIVSILAAVAVPQYNRAVEKTRLVQLRVRLDALYKSAQLYELANGQWPSDVRDLDLDVTSEAQEITQSEITTSSHHAAKYDEDSWCGVHVSPSGNRSAWCRNKHVTLSIIRGKFSCTCRTSLGEELCAGEK